MERLRSEARTPALPTTSPETLRLEELHEEMSALRARNTQLEETNEELQATLLHASVEQGRLLTATGENSLAAELEAMTHDEVCINISLLMHSLFLFGYIKPSLCWYLIMKVAYTSNMCIYTSKKYCGCQEIVKILILMMTNCMLNKMVSLLPSVTDYRRKVIKYSTFHISVVGWHETAMLPENLFSLYNY